MATKPRWPAILGMLVLAAILVAGLQTLVSLRFSAGDIYPEYSSYRADPKGTKILYRALGQLPGLSVGRQLRSWDLVREGEGSTVLLLGCKSDGLPDIFSDEWSTFMLSGGRAIVALAPESSGDEPRHADAGEPAADDPDDPPEEDHDAVRSGAAGYEMRYFPESDPDSDEPRMALPELDGEALAWHGPIYFDNLSPEWQVLYRLEGKPVVMERAWGRGSVVLMSDSYLFSNESMVLDRHTKLLTAWIGSPARILFDECHLGVVSQEGVMMLAARYRLRGVLVALLILTALFVWQRMSSFIPRHPDAAGEDNTVGAWVDSGEGFNNLLMRHIPPKQLSRTLLKEWDDTFGSDPSMRKKQERLHKEYGELVKAGANQHPLTVYNHLLKVLKERK